VSLLLRLLPLLAVFVAPPAAAQPRPGGADSLLLTAAQLANRLTRGNVVLVHVGEPADYKAGHIPGARFLPYDAISQRRDGLMLEMPPVAVLDSVEVDDAARASPDKRVISYCHIGQQATVVYFAAKLLGRDARLYDGSWDEWSRRSGLPIETGMGNRHE